MGINHAERLLEGNYATWVKLKTDSIITDLNKNKALILLLHYDNKYFLTRKITPIPNQPIVYIIPDNQIELVIMSRKQNLKE